MNLPELTRCFKSHRKDIKLINCIHKFRVISIKL